MSKIIKANHLIVVRTENCDQPDYLDEKISSENKEIFYQEAKIIVEELITEAKTMAGKILKDAKTEAKNILTNAHQQAEELKKRAYLDGFQSGEEAGLLDVQNLKEQANDIIKRSYKEREKILGGMESEIIDFAVKLSEKVIRTQISDKQEIVTFIVQDLLALVQDSTQVTVKLSNLDYKNLKNQKEELQSILNYGVLNFEQDCTLSRGDCIVISESGIVVAKIDEQLEKLHEILQEVTRSD